MANQENKVDLGLALRYYKRPEIQNAIIAHAKGREIAVRFDYGFGKRPDTLAYPNDVLELAKQRATSFHVSEERWQNPLLLSPSLKRHELDSLRTGWDLVLDIDCYFWEYSKLTAYFLIEALKHHNIKSISCKFSGNKGFHIGVPFEAFPEKIHDKFTKDLFPEGPKKIALYLAELIKKPLADKILSMDTIGQIIETTGKSFEEITENGQFNPFSVIEIDTLLISSRHLYRMPYSLHEKSALVSLPISPDEVLSFDKSSARPENVKVNHIFLDSSKAEKNEARELMLQAFDFAVKAMPEQKENEHAPVIETYTDPVPVELFPPCIKNILNGLEDGRKRSLFVLTNFLRSVNWDFSDIEQLLYKWNKKNKEELREVTIKGHLSYARRLNKKVLPPNCSNKMYYKDISICSPDALCQKIKNPVNYALIRARQVLSTKPKREKLTEEQKEMRRRYREKLRQQKESQKSQNSPQKE